MKNIILLALVCFAIGQLDAQIERNKHWNSERNLCKTERPTYDINSRIPPFHSVTLNHSKTIRNRNEKTERVDSITQRGLDENGTWVNGGKVIYGYTDDQLLSWTEEHLPYFGSSIIPFNRTDYLYDENRNCIQQTRYDWLPMAGIWEFNYRQKLTYNTKNQLIESQQAFWESGEWLTFWKETYTYDTNDLVAEYTTSYGTPLQERRKEHYFYNTNHDLILQMDSTKSFSSEDWEPYEKIEYTYNSQQQETRRIIYVWQSDSFVADFRVNNAYDLSGNLSSATGTDWNGIAWENSYLDMYSYNDHDLLTDATYSNWDGFTSQWVGYFRYQQEYNEFDDIIRQVDLDWDEETGMWVSETSYELIYDTSTDGENIVWPESPLDEDGTFLFNKKLLLFTTSEYDKYTEEWKVLDSVRVFYSLLTSSLDIVAQPSLLYPNPATTEIMIDLEDSSSPFTLQLLTIDGKEVLKVSAYPGKAVSLQNIVTGTYIYSVQSGSILYTGKLYIQQ